jgi:hypothetical protein
MAAQDTPQPFRAFPDDDGSCRRSRAVAKEAVMKLALYFVLSLALIVAGSLTFTMILLRG